MKIYIPAGLPTVEWLTYRRNRRLGITDYFIPSSNAGCVKIKPLTTHGIPWQHNKNLHRCDTERLCHNDGHKRGHHRVS